MKEAAGSHLFLAGALLLSVAGSALAQDALPGSDFCAAPVEHILPQSGLSITLAPEEGETPCTPAPPPPPPRPASPDIFGSVALAVGSTPLDARWQAAHVPVVDDGFMPWHWVVQRARAVDHLARLQLINNWVNGQIAFAEDSTTDHWASLAESIARGSGDCEDYAIAKMQLLEQAGVASGDMYLVIVEDKARQTDHAVLVVRDGDELLVLDNKTDRILGAEQVRDYRPIVSFSSTFAWTHGYRSVRSGEPLGTVAPGSAPR